jgi:hypothetical protein
MNKQGLVNFFEKNDLRLGALLFVLAVFFTHAPFFLYIPVPAISMDSFNYYWFAKEIFDGKLPVINQPHDFPWGYPLFLFLVKYCGGNILHVVFLQCVVFVAAGVFLIYQFKTLLRFGGVVAALALIVFVIQPHTIRHNVALTMESFYTSGLLFLVSSVVIFFRRKDLLAFLTVIASVLFLMLIRPNGIIMLIVPLGLICYSVYNKIHFKPFFLALIGLILVNILGNYLFKGQVSFGDSKRIEKVLGRVQKRFLKSEKTSRQLTEIAPKKETTVEMFDRYFFNVTSSKPSFYYSLQSSNYDLVVVERMDKSKDLRMFDGRESVDTFAPGLTKFIFEGYAIDNYDTYNNVVNYESNNKNKWTFLVHLLYEIYNKIKVAYLIYFTFWVVVFMALYQVIVLKCKNDFWILILCLTIIHLASLFLLPFIHNRFQLRYIHVSEFIVYINAFIGVLFWFSVDNNAALHKEK